MRAARPRERGFTLIEVMVSLVLLVFVTTAMSGYLVQSMRTNKAEEMALATQANARNCMTMIQAALRNAGWDPRALGLTAIALDPTPAGADNYIEVFADLDGDGDTADAKEAITIRHHNDTVEWKTTTAATTYVVLADDVTNDADRDGTVEPMFTPDSSSDPKRITVQITVRSPAPDPRTGSFMIYTLKSEITLRGRL
jgi:prepilin-type N-terminal cleavage/methylation domain-containing protein